MSLHNSYAARPAPDEQDALRTGYPYGDPDGFGLTMVSDRAVSPPKPIEWSPAHPMASFWRSHWDGNAQCLQTDALPVPSAPFLSTTVADHVAYPAGVAVPLGSLPALFSATAATAATASADFAADTAGYGLDTEPWWWASHHQNQIQLSPWHDPFDAESAHGIAFPTTSTSSPFTTRSPGNNFVEHRLSQTPSATQRGRPRIDHDTGTQTSGRLPTESPVERAAEFDDQSHTAPRNEQSSRASPAAEEAAAVDQQQQRWRNREAAARYRKKTQGLRDDLEAKEQEMRSEHRSLSVYADQLREELYNLKTELLRHSGCGCPRIQRYLDNAVRHACGATSPLAEAESQTQHDHVCEEPRMGSDAYATTTTGG